MLPAKIKTLIDKYCMGVNPSDAQMDEIMDMAMLLNVKPSEVSAYMKEMISGPTKEEREAEAKAKEEAKRKKEEERKKREAKKKLLAEEQERKEKEERLKREEEERKIRRALEEYNARSAALLKANIFTSRKAKSDLKFAEQVLDGMLKWKALEVNQYRGGIFYAVSQEILFIKGNGYMPEAGLNWENVLDNSKEILKVVFLGDIKSVNLRGLTNLLQVTLPDTAIKIEDSAFCESSIKRIVSKPLEHIGSHAFYKCSDLDYINMSKNITIGDKAFVGCHSLPDALKSFILAHHQTIEEVFTLDEFTYRQDWGDRLFFVKQRSWLDQELKKALDGKYTHHEVYSYSSYISIPDIKIPIKSVYSRQDFTKLVLWAKTQTSVNLFCNSVCTTNGRLLITGICAFQRVDKLGVLIPRFFTPK